MALTVLVCEAQVPFVRGGAEALVRELEEELGIRIEPHVPEYLGAFTAHAANETKHTVRAKRFTSSWI